MTQTCIEPELSRVPPSSIQAEACVLGSMVLESAAIDEAVSIVKAEDFYRPVHGTIFSAITAMHDANRPIDLVLLRDELETRGQLEQVGVEYLLALAEGVPDGSNVGYYARIVRDKAALRKLIVASTEILREAYDARGDAGGIIEAAEQRVFAITQGHVEQAIKAPDALMASLVETLEQRCAGGNEGLATGFRELDAMTGGLHGGEFCILAGRPSMGKTSAILCMALEMALSGVPVGVFSMEMSSGEVSARLLAALCRYDLRLMRTGKITADDWSSLQVSAADLGKCPFWVDDTAALTPTVLRAKARRMVAKHGVKAVFVDYVQLMATPGRRNDSRQEQVSEISRSLKAMAKELSVPVIAAAQLNRGPEGRESHRPRMSDLRESGALEQDADLVMLLHNEDYYHRGEPKYDVTNLTELIVAKQRNGPVGTVPLVFLPHCAKFENAAKEI